MQNYQSSTCEVHSGSGHFPQRGSRWGAILLLGGTAIQIPIIHKAHEMGLRVITCDNRPDNPGHTLSDEYHNVDITDEESVLRLAKQLRVDAVVNYSLEAGVKAAAYAQEKLGKPTSPYSSVCTLSDKKLFRQFLREHGFCTPRMITCRSKEDALSKIQSLKFPVVVKPTDLWGSRGVTRVDANPLHMEARLSAAIDYALSLSRGGEVIIEEFVEPCGQPIEGSAFAIDGVLTTRAWSDVYDDPKAENPITPVTFCYPSTQPAHLLDKLDSTLSRLLSLLGMKTNAYNVEARIDSNGDVYLMEVAPRNGGNTSHDILSLITGQDVQRAIILAALGEDCSFMRNVPYDTFWMGHVVHTNTPGTYQGLWTDDDFRQRNLVRYTPFLQPGSPAGTYSGTNKTIGALHARFATREEMMEVASNTARYFRPIVR